jgi:AraC-like DNA-binding protein
MAKSENIYYPTGETEKTFVNSIWWLSEDDLHNRKEIILPKGTVEIIFNFSDNIIYLNPTLRVSKMLPIVFINGNNFKPFELIKTGRQEFLGIQLKSAGLKLIFNLSVKEFNDKVYAGNEIGCHLDLLADELFFAKTFQQKVEIILKWLEQRISKKNYPYFIERVRKLQCLGSDRNLTVKDLCQEIYISDRQLRRISSDWLGMSIEEYILYNKYLTSLHLLHNTNLYLTDVGYKAGYYDQSHFIREFKSYTELTPKQYRKANKDLPGHIFL